MDNDDAMKNERCLIKKIIKINEKIVKLFLIFIGFTFLTGFYDERNIHIDLEEITLELGEILPQEKLEYINTIINNSNFHVEDNVPTNENGETIKIGSYSYYIVYRDEERKYSRLSNKKSTISVIDTIKPNIQLKETSLEFEHGSNINVNDIALCNDLSECTLSFENDIDTKVSGVHEVTIVATDEGNNISKKTFSIKIKEKPVYSYYMGNYTNMDNNNNYINSGLSEEEKMIRRNEIISYAKLFEGNPYVYGGTSLTNGTDCSGFTMSVYNYFGYQLPRSAGSQGYVGIPVSYDQLLPGDLVVYYYDNGGGHVGLYIGNGIMIHAGTEQTGIIIAPVFAGNKVYRRIIY